MTEVMYVSINYIWHVNRSDIVNVNPINSWFNDVVIVNSNVENWQIYCDVFPRLIKEDFFCKCNSKKK